MATVTAQRLHPTVELFYAQHIKTIWNMFFHKCALDTLKPRQPNYGFEGKNGWES